MESNIKKEEPEPDKPNSLGATIQEPNLHQLLELLVEEIDSANKKKPHEIILGLDQQGIRT